MSKNEYQEKLETIRDFRRKKFENFFEAWSIMDHPEKHIALSLYILAETLIAKELYQFGARNK